MIKSREQTLKPAGEPIETHILLPFLRLFDIRQNVIRTYLSFELHMCQIFISYPRHFRSVRVELYPSQARCPTLTFSQSNAIMPCVFNPRVRLPSRLQLALSLHHRAKASRKVAHNSWFSGN